ncbi:MAG TPA: ABC transporter ATP-binding protein [Labilithrix sp.]|nr:ABC transporter ATP-binding protein [Labilithrix sp.]
MSAAPAIRVEGLAHRFGSFHALTSLSFEVGRGAVFGFIGPNGAGKTTTIRAIATLHQADAGQIEVCGVDVRADPGRVRRLLGYMPDHAGVYERISGAEYLEFFAAVQDLPPGRVAEVARLTGVEGSLDRDVSKLSKGLQQRMQLARILLHDPEVLILDEPASDLDPRARIELRELVLELRRRDKTILLSSHILTELSDICTHVGIVDRGRMIAYGPIGEIGARIDATLRGERPPSTHYRTGSDPERRSAKLRVIGERATVEAALASVPLVKDVIVSALGSVSLSYSGDERTLGEVVRALGFPTFWSAASSRNRTSSNGSFSKRHEEPANACLDQEPSLASRMARVVAPRAHSVAPRRPRARHGSRPRPPGGRREAPCALHVGQRRLPALFLPIVALRDLLRTGDRCERDRDRTGK